MRAFVYACVCVCEREREKEREEGGCDEMTTHYRIIAKTHSDNNFENQLLIMYCNKCTIEFCSDLFRFFVIKIRKCYKKTIVTSNL